MSILLGVPDEKVGDRSSDFTTNKIGGLPDWVVPGSKIPTCRCCGRVMSLAVQLYCPLEGSQYHRTLYLFSCHSKTCWGKPESWTTLRSQQLDESFITKAKKPEKVKTSATSEDWGVAADDWGVDADDWETGTDDFGSGSDNILAGNTMSETEVKGERSDVNTGHDLGTSWRDVVVGSSAVGNVNLSEMSCNSSLSQDQEELLSTGGSNDLQGEMAQLNVHDFDDSDSEKSDSNIVMDTDSVTLKVTEEGVKEMMSLLVRKVPDQNSKGQGQTSAAESCHGNEGQIFESYYISVFYEPETVEESTSHIQDLIRNYRQKERGDFDPLPAEKGRSKGGGETYEEDHVVHGDKYFYKFTKRIAACPQQCIRYQWNGNPLYISRPDPKMATALTCGQCGGQAVYELQLLPALVNFLRIRNTTDPATEFGTVIVYSCRGSCWRDTDTTLQEATLVQPDPDNHLFR